MMVYLRSALYMLIQIPVTVFFLLVGMFVSNSPFKMAILFRHTLDDDHAVFLKTHLQNRLQSDRC